VPLVPEARGVAREIKRWRILNNAGEFER